MDETAFRESSIAEARAEALKEGEQIGLHKGRIEMLQELLGLTEPTREELATYEPSQLNELADQLRHQLRTRGV